MQFRFKYSVQFVLFVVGIVLSPTVFAIQRPNDTIPGLLLTPIVDVQSEGCPKLVYLPILFGTAGTALQSSGSFADTRPQQVDNRLLEEEEDNYHTPIVLAPSLLYKLNEIPVITSTLIYTEATSLWEYPSPDPSGIDWFAPNQVIISDSEVNEEQGRTTNIWIFDVATRQVLSTTSTLTNAVTDEPADITRIDDGKLIFVDDNREEIIVTEMDASGGLYRLYSLDTTVYGSEDPEGIDAFVTSSNELYLVTTDGASNTIYIHRSGNNGRFDGTCFPNDDTVRSFNTADLGILNSEGIYAVPDEAGDGVTFYLVGDTDRQHIYVIHAQADVAELVSKIDVGILSQYHKMAGIVVMPNSQIVLVFRGVNNDNNPDENDGILAVIEPHHTQE